ncbi:MAG: hypothetical protein ACK40G_11255 [Cytophagaceae bacterium]
MKEKNKHWIDDLLKINLENLEETPSPAIWEKIEKNINNKKDKRILIWPWLLIIAILSAIACFSYKKSSAIDYRNPNPIRKCNINNATANINHEKGANNNNKTRNNNCTTDIGKAVAINNTFINSHNYLNNEYQLLVTEKAEENPVDTIAGFDIPSAFTRSDSSVTKKDTANSARWFIEIFASPGISTSTIQNTATDSLSKHTNVHPSFSISFGMLIGIKVSEKINLKSGVSFNYLSQTFIRNNRTIVEQNDTIGRSYYIQAHYDTLGNFIGVDTNYTYHINKTTDITTRDEQFHERFYILTIPVILETVLLKKRENALIFSPGIGFNYMARSRTAGINQYGNLSQTSEQDYHKIFLTLMSGLNAQLMLSDNIHMNTGFFVNYTPASINKRNKEKQIQMGFNLGLKIKL